MSHEVSKRLCGLIAVILPVLALFASPAQAGWSGSEITKNGTVHVINPPTPIETASTISVEELWRVGGDDEDVLFGVITSIVVDSDGLVYLLDAQINVVHVFSPDGEFLREIGHEGEGPGEFRRAENMFLTPEGNVAVVQGMPGKIIQLTPQGVPLDNYKLPQGPDGGPMFLGDGVLAGDQLVLSTRDFSRAESGFSITNKLVRVNSDGEVTATYNESTREQNMANMAIDEKRNAEPLFTASSDGRVFIHDDWDAYAIKVYGRSGTLKRVIEREFKPRKRTAEEMEANKPRAFMRGHQGAREIESTAAETDRNVRELFARDNGMLWVVNSWGAADSPEGTVATFDVFEPEGRFVQQISIECEGDFTKDGLHFVGDKLIIVKELRTSRRAMFADLTGGDESTGEREEIEPLSVICYDLGSIASAKR
ncbi:MAG: 6-bladed beta-propeller [Candidatus Krumholzibacteria bacterium]|nr:6-bladed beta-propeller [Candidatus Krumholzibacteria bacterium]MCK5408601.1 6-bladed beta-propeller [Candidatus Krumholzibacteria bacterium]